MLHFVVVVVVLFWFFYTSWFIVRYSSTNRLVYSVPLIILIIVKPQTHATTPRKTTMQNNRISSSQQRGAETCRSVIACEVPWHSSRIYLSDRSWKLGNNARYVGMTTLRLPLGYSGGRAWATRTRPLWKGGDLRGVVCLDVGGFSFRRRVLWLVCYEGCLYLCARKRMNHESVMRSDFSVLNSIYLKSQLMYICNQFNHIIHSAWQPLFSIFFSDSHPRRSWQWASQVIGGRLR